MYVDHIFFFKQKTAYEMRISDWSSDVCSSDLPSTAPPRMAASVHESWRGGLSFIGVSLSARIVVESHDDHIEASPRERQSGPSIKDRQVEANANGDAEAPDRGLRAWPETRNRRSEEQKSELQSLMRLPTAGFC